jgi:predicted protein tyrosine phosphatase
MKIVVMNRREAQAARPGVPYAIVSATNPELVACDYITSPLLRRELHLTFHDIRHPCCAHHQLFAEEHVTQLVAFAEWIGSSDIGVLIVHCDAGISRSSAIALAFARYLGVSDDEILNPARRHRPNPFIFWRLARALMPGREAELIDAFYRWILDNADALAQQAGDDCVDVPPAWLADYATARVD